MKSNNFLRSTLRIARIELNTLFFSPVAWLVLVIFAFQVGMTFTNVLDSYIHSKILGHELYSVTGGLFNGMRGLFPSVVDYLYLYIPLVSMGLMSREFASGSIKLLYSSPVSNTSIILGKYLAIVTYGLALMGILLSYTLYAAIITENFDAPQILAGLLGIFLLLCTYSAIGLFMSTITSYQVVAGVGTLAMLAALNYIGDVGQSTAFVRDITYWLSIKGRVYEFISGMIPSEATLYFVTLIIFFIILSIIKLNTDRSESNIKRTIMTYGASVLCLIAVAYITSRPHCKFYYDGTYTQSNTLAEESIDVVSKLEGPMTITTYVNLLDDNAFTAVPKNIKDDFQRFEKFTRFKPEIKMEYVYYWADCGNEQLRSRYPGRTDAELADIVCQVSGLKFKDLLTKEQIDQIIDLEPEGYHFVRIVECGDGKKTVLRMFNDMERQPGEAEISAAFKCFIETSPRVAIITGHGDRTMANRGSRGYNLFSHNLTFRNSLINQGFDPLELDITQNEIPTDISVIVISDLKTPLSEVEQARIDAYIARGGNMFLLSDVNRADNMNPIVKQFGIKFSNNILAAPVKDQDATLIPARISERAEEIYPLFKRLRRYNQRVALTGSVTIETIDQDSTYSMIPLLISSSEGVWTEFETTDFIEDSVIFNPSIGEKQGEHLLSAAFTRKVADKDQRIVVVADADCVSNEGLSGQYWFSAANFSLINGAFRWMSYDHFPINTRHADPIDNDISLKGGARMWNKVATMGLFPGLLLLAGLMLIIKRQRG